MLEQSEEFDDNEDTLIGSPDRQAKRGRSSGEKERTISEKAPFMGILLEDTDSEVNDVDDIDHGHEDDRQDTDGSNSVLKPGKVVWGRDENGRLVEKRKRSA